MAIAYLQTSSRSWRNLLSCVSNWRLCSSRIFIRASRRVLCCLNRRASASMSLSTSDVGFPDAETPLWCGMGVASSGDEENENDMEGDCCERRRSYSACKVAFSSSSSLHFPKINRLSFNRHPKNKEINFPNTESLFRFLPCDSSREQLVVGLDFSVPLPSTCRLSRRSMIGSTEQSIDVHPP